MSDPIQLSIETDSTMQLSTPVINQIIEAISPSVDTEPVEVGTKVTITDKNGDHEFTVLNGTDGTDGDPGEDGVSPVATVSKEGSVATISVTDASGTTEVTVSDGEDGETPVRGTDYWTEEDQAAIIEDVEEAIIDDTAGDGDTTKTWSADKLVDEFDAKADVSDIPDVSGFYTKPSDGIPSSDMTSAVQASLGKADTAYQKPSGGIPSTDIASGVIPDVSGKLNAPSVAGTNGQVLTSNGSGSQTWETPTAPTSIIDDNAGDGDTTKVWSADKLHDEVSTLSGAITQSQTEEDLLRSEMPGTATTVTMDSNGNPTSIVHTANSETVRTDSFVWGTGTVTETRTLANGKYITITTNLETLAQTISAVQEVA